jgi:hypothetical protein
MTNKMFDNFLIYCVQVSNLVKGLADTGFTKSDFPEDCRELLLGAVLRDWDQMYQQEIAMTILG